MPGINYVAPIGFEAHQEISDRCSDLIIEATRGTAVSPIDGYPAVSSSGRIWHVAILGPRNGAYDMGYAIRIFLLDQPVTQVDESPLAEHIQCAIDAAARHVALWHGNTETESQAGNLPYQLRWTPNEHRNSRELCFNGLRNHLARFWRNNTRSAACSLDHVIMPDGQVCQSLMLVTGQPRMDEGGVNIVGSRGMGFLVHSQPNDQWTMLQQEIMTRRVAEAVAATELYGWRVFPGDQSQTASPYASQPPEIDYAGWHDR